MFAKLGNIQFDIMPYVSNMDETSSSNYVEHAVIEGKPKLQYMGENLDEINFSVKFHFSYCNPAQEIKKLKDSKTKAEAMPLIYGNGERAGEFVITEIRKTAEQNDAFGNIISINADVRLKEFSEPPAVNASTKKKTAPKPPILSTAVKSKQFAPDPVKVSEIRTRVNEKIQNGEAGVIVAITRKSWLDEELKTGAAA